MNEWTYKAKVDPEAERAWQVKYHDGQSSFTWARTAAEAAEKAVKARWAVTMTATPEPTMPLDAGYIVHVIHGPNLAETFEVLVVEEPSGPNRRFLFKAEAVKVKLPIKEKSS